MKESPIRLRPPGSPVFRLGLTPHSLALGFSHPENHVFLRMISGFEVPRNPRISCFFTFLTFFSRDFCRLNAKNAIFTKFGFCEAILGVKRAFFRILEGKNLGFFLGFLPKSLEIIDFSVQKAPFFGDF